MPNPTLMQAVASRLNREDALINAENEDERKRLFMKRCLSRVPFLLQPMNRRATIGDYFLSKMR